MRCGLQFPYKNFANLPYYMVIVESLKKVGDVYCVYVYIYVICARERCMILSSEYLLWLQVFMLMLEDLKTWLILLIEIQMLKLNTSRCQFLRQTLSSKLSQKEKSNSRLQTVFHSVVNSFWAECWIQTQKFMNRSLCFWYVVYIESYYSDIFLGLFESIFFI